MRKIKEVLRLNSKGLTNRQISKSVNVARSTVAEYLKRFDAAGLTWPLPEETDEAALERLLFPVEPQTQKDFPMPDLAYVHTELKRKGVTLRLLWEEYLCDNPGGYQYTQFCHYYRKFKSKLNLSMRQNHKAGEKMFVDFAGQTIGIVDSNTGEIQKAQIFLAVLGASNYTYAEAVRSQELFNWISCHTHAFEFFGGVTELVVPDNLKTGVTKPCRYEPDINSTYQDMAEHYRTVVIPTRIVKPKDKAKVEVGVQVAERWILARLRNHTFFSLAELNREISKLLEKLNTRPFAKLEGNRKTMFEKLDRPALLPLPEERYEFARFKKATVNIDYHIEIERHYYSVPYQLAKEVVEARITKNSVEILFKGKRVASHMRNFKVGAHTTIPEHMPKSHRRYLEWTPKRLINWAKGIGPNTSRLAEAIMKKRNHPEQGFRSVMGILRLSKSYPNERLEAACTRALKTGALSYKSVSMMLKNNLENMPVETQPSLPVIEHDNIRGTDYFH